MDELNALVKDSLLPAVFDLVNTTKALADGYSADHKEVLAARKTGRKELLQNQEVSSMLVKSVDALSGHITDLVASMNEANRLAAKQNQMLETIQDSLLENTARLKALAMVQETQTEDPGTKALYERLQQV